MRKPDKHQITRLLMKVNEGDKGAEEELIDLIYLELRQMARRIIFEEGLRCRSPSHAAGTVSHIPEHQCP